MNVMLSTLVRGLKLSRREVRALLAEGIVGLLSMTECETDRGASVGWDHIEPEGCPKPMVPPYQICALEE